MDPKDFNVGQASSLSSSSAGQRPTPRTDFSTPLAEQSAEPDASMMPSPPGGGAIVDRANALVSLVVLIAVLGCVTIAVYPLVSDWTLPRDMHPLALMLWLRGEDVTVEEWLERTAQAQQQEFDKMFQQSPAYEFNSEEFRRGLIYQPDVNWSEFGQFNSPPPAWQPSSSYP